MLPSLKLQDLIVFNLKVNVKEQLTSLRFQGNVALQVIQQQKQPFQCQILIQQISLSSIYYILFNIYKKMSYNFKTIKVIPPAAELINIILSKTQRKTPTVVHPGYAISRIRSFYMRKIKFCQQSLNEKLLNILQNFPKIQDIHPFYGDLFNVLYDKDHYKLALGHVKATKNMVDNMSKDYLKLVKYADSLYRCKSLKRAALGRICTMIRKINSSLSFLEQVRKHLARLPTINPYQRTILLTGYPNVGKSSFINSVSKANVQVQPYPFTTQALYVGHTQYKNLRYQVIDSPGILDHGLDEMNTIQMQSITALAHLKSCVIYFVDPSEQCGYSVLEQIHLYNTIKPLFKNKPVVVAFNKSDLKKVEELSKNKKQAIQQWLTENNLKFAEISTLQGQNINTVKQIACELVYNIKLPQPETKTVKSQQNYINGLYVSQPKKRDNLQRPSTTVDFSQKVKKDKTIRQIQQQEGGTGVFNIPLQVHYVIPEQWKYDCVPEIYNGKNIADFVDPDIWEKLEDLQKEEDLLLEMEGMKLEDDNLPPEVDSEIEQAYKQIKQKKQAFRQDHALKRNKTAYQKNKSMDKLKKTFQQKGIDSSLVEERMRNRSRSKSLMDIKKKRGSSPRNQMMEEDQQENTKVRSRIRQSSRSRSKGYHREMTEAQTKGETDTNKLSKKWRTMDKKGQSDRFVGTKMPKHLYTGKTGKGSRDWR